MWSEVLGTLGNLWCHSAPQLAELILLSSATFGLGFCCGGVVVGLIVSAHCRSAAARVICYLLEGVDRERERGARGEVPRTSDRLQRYRA